MPPVRICAGGVSDGHPYRDPFAPRFAASLTCVRDVSRYPERMLLKSEETQTEFEFRVVGYQFPDVVDEDYDANWLLVSIGVRSPGGSWSKTDPCLLTWEGHWFGNWLADIMAGREGERAMSFLDSNLFFEVERRDPKHVKLKIELSDELLPKDAKPGDKRFEVSLVISLADLRSAAADWCWEMRLFPMRLGKAKPCRPYNDKRAGCAVCQPEKVGRVPAARGLAKR